MTARNSAGTYEGRVRILAVSISIAAVVLGSFGVGAATGRPHPLEARLPEVRNAPPAPRPEPVVVTALPLPPTAPSDAAGSCTRQVNPRGTGCMSGSEYGMQEGPGYMWDSRHVLMTVTFIGAPAAPDPASIYSGSQVLAIRTDGSLFANGDAWKCLTCGVPEANRQGTLVSENPMGGFGGGGNATPRPARMPLDHPQAFPDGRRVLAGPNVVDCSPYQLVSPECTAERVKIYPVRWGRTADGSGRGAIFREQRLNPDGVHINWNAFAGGGAGIEQFGYLGRLVFNPAPKSGEPRVPRYDIEDVYQLVNNRDPSFQTFSVDPKNPGRLIHNEPRGQIGEMRGWTRDGRSVIGMGFQESGNADIFITNLQHGASHRLTRDPAYTDPMIMSPDDKWLIAMDGRTTERHLYYSAMQGIPPLLDMMTLGITVCCYNNGNRRFFQPIMIDVHGDRGSYRGQQLNAGPGTPGSPSDPNWNGRADPAWSPDGTNVVYWQALVTAPACGGKNPLPCPASTEPGGRRTRLMKAQLTSRKPMPMRKVAARPIKVDWAVPLKPGDPLAGRGAGVPPGKYVLYGKVGGRADVEIGRGSISVRYTNFTDDGGHIINGTESATSEGGGMMGRTILHSDLRSSGIQNGTKKTGPNGLVFSFRGATDGELVTTIDGKEYRRWPSGT
jgi:hypothetical protein